MIDIQFFLAVSKISTKKIKPKKITMSNYRRGTMANKYMKGMLSVTSHQGNRNQNHNEKPPHPCMSNDYPKKQDEKEKSNKTKTISKSRDHPMLKGNSRANSAVGLVSPVISLLSIQHPGLSTQKVLSFFSF